MIILVVEDDYDVGKVLVEMIRVIKKDLDPEIIWARNVREAEETLFNKRILFDVVLMDYDLRDPEKTGLTLAKRVRDKKNASRIVILSGLPDNLAVSREEGFLTLPKPSEVDDLRKILN